MNHSAIRQLEHISLRAWDALESEAYDGWLLRAARGYTGRANSVQALHASTLPLEEKIAYCKRWYAARDLPCLFRLTPAMQPPQFDQVLADKGYIRYNETLVQTAPLGTSAFEMDARCHCTPQLTDRWLMAWAEWNAVPSQHVDTARAMLSRDGQIACFASLDQLAVGLAVVEEGYVGLFDIVVHPKHRRQGLGGALVRSLLAWGQTQGAHTAYLQVVAGNDAALALYRHLGFTTHHHYWYRRQQGE